MSERKPLTGTNPSCGDLDKLFIDEGKEKKKLICSCFVRVKYHDEGKVYGSQGRKDGANTKERQCCGSGHDC